LSLFGGGRRSQTRYCYIRLLTPVEYGEPIWLRATA